VQVDLPELGSIDASTRLRAFGLVAVGDQEQRLSGQN
jgi:hypothetical protein